jgi:hypothetical protein
MCGNRTAVCRGVSNGLLADGPAWNPSLDYLYLSEQQTVCLRLCIIWEHR